MPPCSRGLKKWCMPVALQLLVMLANAANWQTRKPNSIGEIRRTPSGQVILDFLNGKLPGYFDGGIIVVDADDVAKGTSQQNRIC